MTQRDSSGNGIAMYYNRDVQGRIVARFKNTLANWNATAAGDYYYGYTASGDTPDFVKDGSTVIEKNIQLPGGVLMTIKPAQSGNANKQYSLPNIHGDTLLTTDAAGTNTSTGNGPASAFTYDPFGNIVSGSTFPANADQASFGWLGQHEKFSESNFAVVPIQMGARVYIPGIARFLQVDPVEGGTPNNYVYPTDPINDFDLTGEFGMPSWATNAGRWVGKNADTIGAGITVAGAGVCIVATAGACTVAVVAAAAAGGAISAAIDGTGAKKVKAVRWFGSTKNYKTLAKAISKGAGKARAKAIGKDTVQSYVRSKITDRLWSKWR